jgi:hypothetical protein
MKAVLHINNAAHQRAHGAIVTEGLKRHGYAVHFAHWDAPAPGDLVVIWGWMQRRVIAAAQTAGVSILVMEREHLPDRMVWTSCGFNGLGNRARYARVDDGGARWRTHFAHLEQPWTDRAGYALVCGQVRGDASLYGCDFHAWAENAAARLRTKGYQVVYRPHPLSLRLQNDRWRPGGTRLSEAPLVRDLAGAALVVTFNSTVGVEAVLAGVSTVTCDVGAMAWDVTTHNVEAAPTRPDRTDWAHRLAWTSWREQEIASGEMWERLKGSMPVTTAPHAGTLT